MTPQPADKSLTCHKWAKEECKHQHAPSKCKYANHFFPTVAERISPIAVKLKQGKECPQWKDPDLDCQWPTETCCFAHEKMHRQEYDEHELVAKLIRERPWQAILEYKCTVVDCKERDQEFESIEEVLNHTRSKHVQPLDDSGSWKGEREPIMEDD